MAAQLSSLVLAWLSVGAAVLAAPKSTGNLISPCSLKDPSLGQCMLSQARAVFPHIAAGAKEWGLPPLDPFFVTKIVLHNSGNQAVNMELSGHNFSFHGFRNTTIESIKFDPATLHMEIEISIPRFSGEGQYKIRGQLLLLPISGQGHNEFSQEGHRALLTMDFKRAEKRGMMFLKLDKTHYDMKAVSKLTTYFENLFGNKQLSDNMNKIMNDNSQALLNELKPAIDSAFSDLFQLVLAPMFDRAPLNELFKDAE